MKIEKNETMFLLCEIEWEKLEIFKPWLAASKRLAAGDWSALISEMVAFVFFVSEK